MIILNGRKSENSESVCSITEQTGQLLSEEEKLANVISRFENIDEDDLMDGEIFWKWLNKQPV